jgi:ATP-dependent Lon protease
LNTNIETIYKENQGLIWFLGLMLGVSLFVINYVNANIQIEIKHLHDSNLKKNTQIQIQNDQIIKNQKEYARQNALLNDALIKNSKHDMETVQQLTELKNKVISFERRLNYVTDIRETLLSHENLLKMHHSEIKSLKSKLS